MVGPEYDSDSVSTRVGIPDSHRPHARAWRLLLALPTACGFETFPAPDVGAIADVAVVSTCPLGGYVVH